MNVLVVIHYPIFGGPHNQALVLAEPLATHGVTTTVLLPDESSGEYGNAAQKLRNGGVHVVTVPLGRVRATLDPRRQIRFMSHVPRDLGAIREVIRGLDIDVVQVGGLVNPQGAIAARIERRPVVWQLLDTRPPMTVRRSVMPLVIRLSDVVMSTGYTVAAVHPGADGLGRRLRVFFPPVDSNRFDAHSLDRAACREGFGFSPADLVVGTIGNLNPQKGHEHLVRAAALARKRAENVKVLVVGAAHDTHRQYLATLHGLCREHELVVGRDIVFAGGLDDVRPALVAMDIFVLSSVPRSEGAPTVVEEAMMMNLPVIATDVGAVREVVDHGNTGFVVRAEDSKALAEAVLLMIDAPQMREEFGARAREQAIARFSVEECARIHLDAYKFARNRQNE